MADLSLRLFGEFQLQGTNRSRLATRKAEALLAYLAVSPGRRHHRDKLAGLLWGDKDERKAQHSLSQALHVIRGAIEPNGGEILIAAGGTVTLDPFSIDIDVGTFESLATRQTAEAYKAAVELYRGDLLDGFHIREAAFEDWLHGERDRLRTVALKALGALLHHQRAANDAAAAIDTANRLLTWDPIREETHRALMHLYDKAGRREAAVRQYQICSEILQRELNIEPSAKTKALYLEITDEREEPAAPEQNPSQNLWNKPSVAVLPFENMSDDPDQAYFSDGIAEDLIINLSRFSTHFFVIARNSSFTYKGRAIDVAGVGRELRARYIVDGSVRKSGSRVRIAAQLVDVTTGNHIWADRFDGGLDDVFDLQDQITEKIVVAVVPRIDVQERQRAWRQRPENLDAWDLLQRSKAVSSNSKEGATTRIGLIRDAIERDPEFAVAHAHLALHLFFAANFGRIDNEETAMKGAREAARRSLALDPAEALGHLALGRIHLCDGESELAISDMETAIRLNPNLAFAHHSLGFALWAGVGKFEEALVHFETALRLSPHDTMGWATLMNKGVVLRFLGRYDEAIDCGREACKSLNNGYAPFMNYAASLAVAGRETEAQGALHQALQLEPNLSIEFIRRTRIGIRETVLDQLLDDLRRAGMPEC